MTRIKTNTFTEKEKKILLKLIQKRHPKLKIENISIEYEHEVAIPK